jgi:hypothetical protein
VPRSHPGFGFFADEETRDEDSLSSSVPVPVEKG